MNRGEKRDGKRNDQRSEKRNDQHGENPAATKSVLSRTVKRSTTVPDYEDAQRDSQFASTLSSGIDLLLCYHPGESVLGNGDFAQRTGLSRSTVSRLTHTLVVLGYLRQDAQRGKYRLGASVLAMGYPLLASMQIRQIARPLMKNLADHVSGAVSLGIRDRTRMVYVETARSTDSLVMTPDIGAAIPMLSTAMGCAWLCRAPPGERETVLNQLRVNDPTQYREFATHALEARRAFSQRGYCVNRGEWRGDVFGFAVPLAKPLDGALFVVNCGTSAQSGRFAEIERDIAPRLIALVRSVEVLVGLT
jgi:DNA-binding IclR family transcriptional regulator